MRSIVAFVHDKFYTLIMLLIAGGFATIVAELVWTNHTDGIQRVGVIASIVGVLLGLAALFVRGNARLVVAGLFLVLSISGLMGVFQHTEARSGEEEAYRLAAPGGYQPASYRLQEEDEEGEEGEGGEAGESGEAVPPLAPLGLSGLALMGVVVTVSYSGAEVEK